LAKVETFWRFASGPSGSECGIFALVLWCSVSQSLVEKLSSDL
jgi:hypothetical protein